MSITAKEKMIERLWEKKGLKPTRKRVLVPGKEVYYYFEEEKKAGRKRKETYPDAAAQARTILIHQKIAATSYGTWVHVWLELEEELPSSMRRLKSAA